MGVKISVIGAGSAVFSLSLIRDICSAKNLSGCTVSFMDIDEKRLNDAYALCCRYAKEMKSNIVIEKTMRRLCQKRISSTNSGASYTADRFHGLRSLLPFAVGISSRNCPPSGSECHCITGQKHPSCVARRYRSSVGSGPAKPAMSNPQNGIPVMIVTGCWAFPDFTRDCSFKWDVAVEPGHTQKATHFFSNGYVINKDSKVANEAAKFAAFISSDKEATQIRLDAGWELPPVNDKSILDQYTAKTPPANRQAVFKSLDYLVTPPVITQYTELQDIVGKHLDAAAAGTVTPAQALKDMQAECQKKIDLTK